MTTSARDAGRRARRRPHRGSRPVGHRRGVPAAGAVPRHGYAVLEARAAIGGTWDLFRYPGVRSDSDVFTLSYPFRPWRGPTSLADGAEHPDYIASTAAEAGIERHIRYRTRAVDASWSSARARWSVRTLVGEDATTAHRHVLVPLRLRRLLRLRPRPPARLRRHAGLPGPARAPPALARGPRPHRPAGRRHRQRRAIRTRRGAGRTSTYCSPLPMTTTRLPSYVEVLGPELGVHDLAVEVSTPAKSGWWPWS